VNGIDVEGEDVAVCVSASELVSLGASWAFVRLADAAMAGLRVPNVGLRLLKTGDNLYDVEVNLDLDDIDDPPALTSALFAFAQDLAKRNDVTSYFAGLELASDENTRLFTGVKSGPYRFER